MRWEDHKVKAILDNFSNILSQKKIRAEDVTQRKVALVSSPSTNKTKQKNKIHW